MSTILGLLLLIVYIVAIVGLAALITYAVIRIFPTQRSSKKPDDSDQEPSSGGSTQSGGRLFRSAKRQTG